MTREHEVESAEFTPSLETTYCSWMGQGFLPSVIEGIWWKESELSERW
jgi:hypothetical protein